MKNDFDVFKEYANIVKYNHFESEITRPYNVVYISRKANQHYANSIDSVVEKYNDNIISIQSVPGVFAKIMGEVGILARTGSIDDMRDIIQFSHQKV